MIIYLEGPDGSGKTTLAKQLSETYGYKLITCPPRQTDKSKELTDWLNFITSVENNKLVICDRSFMSELVYRLYDKQDTYLTLQTLVHMLQHCKIVFCDSPTSFTDAMERGEDNIVTYEAHNKIKELYGYVVDMLTLFSKNTPIMSYNWKSDDILDVVRFINHFDDEPKSEDNITY